MLTPATVDVDNVPRTTDIDASATLFFYLFEEWACCMPCYKMHGSHKKKATISMATGYVHGFPTSNPLLLTDGQVKNNNTFIGNGAGKSITTGKNNIILGQYAGSSTDEDTIVLFMRLHRPEQTNVVKLSIQRNATRGLG